MSLSPSRRGVLQAALLGSAAAACTSGSDRPARVDPDDALRAAAIARERDLVARYAALSSAAAAQIHDEHLQHLVALGVHQDPSAQPLPTRSTVGPTAPQSIAQLVQAERAAAAAHAADAIRASRPLAAVLASLAASEASHPVALR